MILHVGVDAECHNSKGVLAFVQLILSFNSYFHVSEVSTSLSRRRHVQVWWVQRTLYNFRVQARKPITVASPTCTFDSTNDRYYPYAMLDADGVAID